MSNPVAEQWQSPFGRVLVGIDGSDESLEAARQAAILVDGELTLLASYDVAPAVGGTGVGVPFYQDTDVQQAAATAALERAQAGVAVPAVGKVVFGRAADALLAEVEQEQQQLLVVGSHGHGRVTGLVLGSTANEVIRKLPCSVLVARRRGGGDRFPTKVVVGVDGSAGSASAYAAARHVCERFDAELWPVVAHGGEVDRGQVDLIVEGRCEELQDEPVAALVAAAADADLLVVGSRGLKGLRALGSVSERVAHQASSSVLIVHPPGTPGAG